MSTGRYRSRLFFRVGVVVSVCLLWTMSALAGDIKITIPRRSQPTPVQRLNREGVAAIQKHDYEKAKALFFKAYLFDPEDPFTLNNLGYVAELEGQVERAQSFYKLASAQGSEALVDRASTPKLEGETLQSAIDSVHDVPLQINQGNATAVRLISEGRLREADSLLQRTLALDPRNEFTLNNLGVAKEALGELREALNYYEAAADSRSNETVVVTTNSSWRGRPVREMARTSAKRLGSRMNALETPETQAKLFNLRGVAAANRNDLRGAWDNFAQAYKLNPQSSFSLNNQGYLAELSGDLETAAEFYREARAAANAGQRVGIATRPTPHGLRLATLASGSENQVSTALQRANEARRRDGQAVQLKHRDGTPVIEPTPASPER